MEPLEKLRPVFLMEDGLGGSESWLIGCEMGASWDSELPDFPRLGLECSAQISVSHVARIPHLKIRSDRYSSSKNQMTFSSRVASCSIQAPLVLWLCGCLLFLSLGYVFSVRWGQRRLVSMMPCSQMEGLGTKGFCLGSVVVLRDVVCPCNSM